MYDKAESRNFIFDTHNFKLEAIILKLYNETSDLTSKNEMIFNNLQVVISTKIIYQSKIDYYFDLLP